MGDIEPPDDFIREAILRDENAITPPADARCYGFPNDVKSALASITPAGW